VSSTKWLPQPHFSPRHCEPKGRGSGGRTVM
jgi:hypothetical protein